MDGLEAQYGGYFIKNIRKLAFFWKKNAQKLASFKKYTYFMQHEKSPCWRYHKNNKELVVIKNHTIYKNN